MHHPSHSFEADVLSIGKHLPLLLRHCGHFIHSGQALLLLILAFTQRRSRRRMRTSENSVIKLSEKGYEWVSERVLGTCWVPKRVHPDNREATVLTPPGLFRQFHGEVRGRPFPCT